VCKQHEATMIETNSRKIIKHLEQDGFVLVSVRGSHHKFEKDGMVIIVPHPKKDMPFGTARAIAKMAGWL
jgi:predicted RNA binding protein YcfA (HicA-like mRNA interferase family)